MVLLLLLFCFIKIAEVVAIKNRTPESMIEGIKKIITSMGKPKQLYSDEESSMRSLKMNRFLNDNDIKTVQTTTHAHTVERFIRTFIKDNLYRRLGALNEDKSDWVKHISSIIKHTIQLNIALLKSSRMRLVKKTTIFGLTSIFKMQPKSIEHTLI